MFHINQSARDFARPSSTYKNDPDPRYRLIQKAFNSLGYPIVQSNDEREAN
jgi:hypothetical protein